MEQNYSEIIQKLQNTLDSYRFIHTMGVKDMCFSLALHYGYDERKAELAGLLHDVAKAYSSSENLIMAKDLNIFLTEDEIRNPQLIHAKLGSFLAKRDYGVEDEEILQAIIFHTTGKPDMNLLEKILYVSDYIEPSRYRIDNLDKIRKIAFEDLDLAVFETASATLEHLKCKNIEFDKKTLETYEYYRELINGRN